MSENRDNDNDIDLDNQPGGSTAWKHDHEPQSNWRRSVGTNSIKQQRVQNRVESGTMKLSRAGLNWKVRQIKSDTEVLLLSINALVLLEEVQWYEGWAEEYHSDLDCWEETFLEEPAGDTSRARRGRGEVPQMEILQGTIPRVNHTKLGGDWIPIVFTALLTFDGFNALMQGSRSSKKRVIVIV
ncbi:hypothetical protein DFH05DRAFT_1463421 [Lentinula detonsa]|uniref:Uncharacterized protein n=1 Tax=Lentinula detonsa TaxID=2804962 RepID=A0A9W8TU50_9AGAR|nr:hypothetical protein DFH05DRAFT_1463421 [Lentinula detonsa]